MKRAFTTERLGLSGLSDSGIASRILWQVQSLLVLDPVGFTSWTTEAAAQIRQHMRRCSFPHRRRLQALATTRTCRQAVSRNDVPAVRLFLELRPRASCRAQSTADRWFARPAPEKSGQWHHAYALSVCVCAHVCACASAHVCGVCVCGCGMFVLHKYVCLHARTCSVCYCKLSYFIHPSVDPFMHPPIHRSSHLASQPASISIYLPI